MRTESSTCRSSASTRSGRASGPICVARSSGSPIDEPPHRVREAVEERVRDRLGDDEPLGGDAALAIVDRARRRRLDRDASTSASASTMNGSEPPSSSTHFLSAAPATAATLAPVASLPVTDTPAMRDRE
jgi:hypothetical protein